MGQQGSYTSQLSVTYLVKLVLSFSDSFIKSNSGKLSSLLSLKAYSESILMHKQKMLRLLS